MFWRHARTGGSRHNTQAVPEHGVHVGSVVPLRGVIENYPFATDAEMVEICKADAPEQTREAEREHGDRLVHVIGVLRARLNRGPIGVPRVRPLDMDPALAMRLTWGDGPRREM